MALRDYICCSECECKIIYDGYDSGRERLELTWGNPEEGNWTVELLCPDCLKQLRIKVAELEAKLDYYRGLEPVAYYDPQDRGFYWAKPTKIETPVTVKVEPIPLYALEKK